MPTVSRTATLAAPLEVVWKTLVDPSWSGSWFGAETSIIKVSGNGLGVRQEITASVKGKGVSLVIETTGYEEGRVLTQRIVEIGGKAIDGLTELACELSAHGTGTAVTVTSSVPEGKGFMGRMLGLGRAHLETAAAQQTLKRLERLAIERYNAAPDHTTGEASSKDVNPDAERSLRSPAPGNELGQEVPQAPPQEEMPGFSGSAERPSQAGPPGASGHSTGELGKGEEPRAVEQAPQSAMPQFEPDQPVSPSGIPEAPPMPKQPEPASAQPVGTRPEAEPVVQASSSPEVSPGTQAGETGPEPADSVTQALAAITPSEEVILERINSWARRNPLVRSGRFTSSPTLEFNPVWECLITRVIEERDEGAMHVPSNKPIPELPRYDCLLESIPVELPTDFEERSWSLIRAGSERVVPCPASCAGGQVQCRRCQGGTVMCSSCLGSGQKTRTRQGAGGQSYQESYPCSWCGGSGRRPCDTCRGNGWLICADCDGSSEVNQFICATILNRPDTVTVSTHSAAPSEIKFKKVGPEEWTQVSLSDGSSVPAGLPDELSAELETALKDVEPGERLRKLEIRVLPVTTVSTDEPQGARAHLVGEGKKVFTRKTVSMKRVFLTGLLLALLLVILLVAI